MTTKKLYKPIKRNPSAERVYELQRDISRKLGNGELDWSDGFRLADGTPKPLDPETAHEIIMSRKMPEKIFSWSDFEEAGAKSLIGSSASNTVQGPDPIAELVRALKNDAQLMFEFVANNIDFVPIYGVQKGGWGALMDGQGTSFDISMLLVEMLRTAGITANFLVGQIQLNAAQATNFLGVPVSPHDAAAGVCWSGQIPYSWTVNGQNELDTLTMSHCWVKWRNPADNQWYVFDPSFKQYTYKTGIDLATATGFNQTSFINNALSGATYDLTPNQFNYIQNLNRTNLRNDLTTYSNNLIQWIRTNDPDACVDDIIGGRSIVPVTIPALLTDLPYHKPGDVPVEYTDIPLQYKITCQIQLTSTDFENPIWANLTFTSEQLHGKALTLWITQGGMAPTAGSRQSTASLSLTTQTAA
ncbi:MAG TPA: transglutaminase-like domain-containing protein [Candidatus Obscuribacterales bacterium]